MMEALEFDVMVVGMEVSKAAPLPAFIQATPTGLILAKDLTFEEWNAIGSSFGTALQTAAWCIGDWMVYGERKWSKQLLLEGAAFDPKTPNRIPSHVFDMAVSATGLDRQTISKYAEVCRKIPMEERRIQLSFGHHRILAPLPSPQRLEWMALLTDSESVKVPTVKRLALSVRIAADSPRVVSEEEITKRGEHAGHDNYGVHMVRLLTVLRKTLPGMSQDQRTALKEDAEQLLEMLNDL
jgi:hypothetical protein